MLATLLVLFAQEIPSTRWERPVHRPPSVHSFEREGKTWYSVHANNASAKAVLEELGRVSRHTVDGLDHLRDLGALVTVELQSRPLDQVLEYTLGGLGLAYQIDDDTIRIVDGNAIDPELRLDLASAAWMRASMRFPDHPSAPQARLSLGEIAERRGLASAARNHYLSLVDDYPESPIVGEAYMRAGRLFASQGQWAEAARLFRTLASLEGAWDYHAPARLEWAGAMIAQGDAQSALYMLTALDSNYPTDDPTEITARRLVRARAYNARQRYMEALRELDLLDGRFDQLAARQALSIRADALEGIGMQGEAARAWLLYATESEGPDQAFAYRSAARLALESGDELGVLFIVRQAGANEVDVALEDVEQEARRRLGLEVAEEEPDLDARITEIEALVEAGEHASARELLKPIYLAHGALEEALGARVVVAWARCLAANEGVESAIGLLGGLRREYEDLEARRTIDIGAARLFESVGRYEEAIDAYQGRYAAP